MGKRKQWNKESMIEAIKAVRDKKMGYKTAVKAFNIPRATLKDYVKSGVQAEECVKNKIGRKPTLTEEVEKLLVDYCMEMQRSYYGMTLADLKRMAFQLAIRNNLSHPFSTETGQAGRKWQRLFLKRHPHFSVRKPQNLSLARIQGFTRENVQKFFSIYKQELEKVNSDPSRIFNVDETGISVVQHRATKIITAKGKKEVHKLASAERGATITAVCSMSAAGQFVPPMLIFPQKQWQVELLDGAPPGSIGGVSESGWINGPLFSKWLEHFIVKVRPTKENPIVLVLDGHYSHTRNIHLIERARETGVSIVCLPPHSTAKMQPMGVCFVFPLKTYNAKFVEIWLSNNPNRIVRKLQVASLFSKGYMQAATLEIAINGFRKTGLYPFNPDIFRETDFVVQSAGNQSARSEHPSTTRAPMTQGVTSLSPLTLGLSLPTPEYLSTPAFPLTCGCSSSQKISPKDIREVPAILPSTSNRRGEAFLVTGTPHKEKVQEATEKKRKAENVEEQPPQSYRKKLPFASSSHPLTKTLDPKITKEFSKISSSALKRSRTTTATSSSGKLPSVYKASSSNSQPSTSDTLKKKSALQQKRRKPFLDTSSDSSSSYETEVVYVSTDNEDSDDDVDCQFCGKPFSGDKCGEKWISCGKCYQWCHELCTSCEIKKHFICDSCLDV